jgi:zinc protease
MTHRTRTAVFVVAVTAAVVVAQAPGAWAQVADWPYEQAPRPLPAREVKFPPYQFRTLANGLQVIAVAHHEQPAVSLRLIIRAGGAQDPADKSGVATLVAALLDQGTTTRDAEQIASSIDSIGGLVGTGAGSDLSFINAIVLKDSFAFGLDMVSDLARNPTFAPEELERQRQQILSGLKVGYEDPDYIAGMVFDRLVYGFHPYGRPDSGTPESITSITRDDLVAYHTAWFGANNAILAIVGDITHDEAFAGAERAFGKWGRSETSAPKPVDPPPPTRRVVVIDRPGAVQTEIRVGNVGLPRRHKDYLALDLAINILGGEGGNRLHRVLRSDRGLTYGASADVNALKDSGNIVADTDTRSDVTGEALRLMVDEFWRLQRQRVQDGELADAQAYLTGSFPLTIETPSAIALQVLNAVFYGLDLTDLQTYRERVNAITPDDIQRVAREYLRPDRLSIVLVGDASVFAKQLAGVGFDQFERIPLSDLDLGSADLKRHGPPTNRFQPAAFKTSPPAPQSPAMAGVGRNASLGRNRSNDQRETVREVIARAVQAKGGLDRLRSIRTVKATATTTMAGGAAGPVTIDTTSYIQYPGSFRVDAKTASGPIVRVFSGGECWVKDDRGLRSAPAAEADQMRSTVQRDVIALLLALADGKVPATRLPDVVEQGRGLTALGVGGGAMQAVVLLLDPATDLILAQRYDAPAGAAGRETVEEQFSDYRRVDGLQVAFAAVVQASGLPVLTRRVRTFELNVPLAADLFSRPS